MPKYFKVIISAEKEFEAENKAEAEGLAYSEYEMGEWKPDPDDCNYEVKEIKRKNPDIGFPLAK